MKTLTKILLVSIAIIASSACSSNSESENETLLTSLTSKSLKALNGSRWTFANYSKTPFEKEYENNIELEFEDTMGEELSFFGRSIINRYVGKLKIDQDLGLIVESQDIATTLIGSPNQKDRDIEADYYENLTKANYFVIENNSLKFYLGDKNDENVEVMNFNSK